MSEVVVKIVLKKDAKVHECKEMVDWISRSGNAESVEVEVSELLEPEGRTVYLNPSLRNML